MSTRINGVITQYKEMLVSVRVFKNFEEFPHRLIITITDSVDHLEREFMDTRLDVCLASKSVCIGQEESSKQGAMNERITSSARYSKYPY
jgi:hypothetical protein